MNSRFRKWYFALYFLFTAATGFAQNPDILGITLGMPIDQAVSVAGPGFERYNTNSTTGRFAVTYLYKTNRESWTFQAIDGKVFYVSHGLNYSGLENQPDPNTTVQRLNAKYGQAVNTGSMTWAWDERLNKLNQRDQIHAGGCNQAFMQGTTFTFKTDKNTGAYQVVSVPKGGFRGDCSVVMQAVLRNGTKSDNTVVMVNFTLSMIDERPYYALAAKEQADAANKKKAQDAAKPVAPF